MNVFQKIFIFFLLVSFSWNLTDHDIKNYHWKLSNLGEIVDVKFFGQNRLVILSGNNPTLAVLNQGQNIIT